MKKTSLMEMNEVVNTEEYSEPVMTIEPDEQARIDLDFDLQVDLFMTLSRSDYTNVECTFKRSEQTSRITGCSRPIALAIRVLAGFKRVQAGWNFITGVCRQLHLITKAL